MISDDVAGFIEGLVMGLVTTRNSANRAFIARASGARYLSATGLIEVLLSAVQWSDVARNAHAGAPIATTFVRPNDYCAYQIKGWIEDVSPASSDDIARAERYVERMLEQMSDLGVTRIQLSHTLTASELMRISFRPTDLFLQTPGPRAGQRLELS